MLGQMRAEALKRGKDWLQEMMQERSTEGDAQQGSEPNPTTRDDAGDPGPELTPTHKATKRQRAEEKPAKKGSGAGQSQGCAKKGGSQENHNKGEGSGAQEARSERLVAGDLTPVWFWGEKIRTLLGADSINPEKRASPGRPSLECGRCAEDRPTTRQSLRCGPEGSGGPSRARLTREEAGGPSPRLQPQPRVELWAAASEERTARVRRGPHPGLPAVLKVPERPAGGWGPWWVLTPLNTHTTKPVRRARPWFLLGPTSGCNARPGRGTRKADRWRGPRAP
ncbi:hypothetical protein NDU88_005175 [Pleurodeles waltl]|uniref:Uncharacterized protein n=1 Tax=Pleurodeles waltl TaxID=8319 RepID=A0AAV7LKF4_PLEWA|nr:hypothetical protein NDU88_005175 [Pleurodeles waltl]